jgi:Holliday junction resolvase
MAATPEKKVKDAVRKLLVEFGIYYFAPAANGFGRAGIPDIICCFGGRFIAIECKAGKGATTALQDRELAAIRTAGGMTMVVNETNIQELKEKLQWMR